MPTSLKTLHHDSREISPGRRGLPQVLRSSKKILPGATTSTGAVVSRQPKNEESSTSLFEPANSAYREPGKGMLDKMMRSPARSLDFDERPHEFINTINNEKGKYLVLGAANEDSVAWVRAVSDSLHLKKKPIVDYLTAEAIGHPVKVESDMWGEKYVQEIPVPYPGSKNCKTDEGREFFNFLEKRPKSPDLTGGETNPEYLARLKRACKDAVNYIVLANKGSIHFITEGFDPIKAFTKSEPPIAYTNSEFRRIVRLWKEDPKVMDAHIRFWKNGKSITPTEYFDSSEEIRKAIKSYHPKHREFSLAIKDQMLKWLQSHQFDPKKGVQQKDDAPLRQAVSEGNATMVYALIVASTDVSKRRSFLQSLQKNASEQGHREVVDTLDNFLRMAK
jgi:hypothetical protein